MQESKTEVVWPREEAIPRLRRKKDSGDGTTWEKKKKKTEAKVDGLCQSRHESYRNDEMMMKSITELDGGELCMSHRPHNQMGAARRRISPLSSPSLQLTATVALSKTSY